MDGQPVTSLLVRPDASENDLRLFEVYCAKFLKLYDTVEIWVKASITVNIAVAGVVIYLLQKSIEADATQTFADRVRDLAQVIVPLALAGFLFSVVWFFTAWDFRKWQLKLNGVMADLEEAFLIDRTKGMWQTINATYPTTKWFGFDMADVNVVVPLVFSVAWLALCAVPWF